MKATTTPEIREVIDAEHYRPAVSVILPFEPKMMVKADLTHRLKTAADKVERELKDNYPEEISTLVSKKLHSVIKGLNFDTHKKSIAIYVSPVFEKVLYLDMPVEEKILVDESFEIRDLVYSKKQIHKYLVLLLDEKDTRIYLGNTDTFVRIVSNTAGPVDNYLNDIPERVANFTDIQQRWQTVMDKYLQHIDTSLDIILKTYQLPLFVLGPAKMIGHFKTITKHQNSVIEFVEGNYDNATLPELKEILVPHVADWKQVKQKELTSMLDEAMGQKKLAAGMKSVWSEAMHHKGRLLVVEKNFMYAAEHADKEDAIYKAAKDHNQFSLIKDAVDDVIEKVLENGGDVEFVDEGVLGKYDHIALIQYY